MFLVFVLLNFLGNIAVEVTGNVLGVRAFLDKLESSDAVETISRAEFMDNLAPVAFVMFLILVFRGIAFFGMASVSLKAARREEEKWCGVSMAGFIRPIGLAWFTFAVMARILFWTLLFVVPGIIAAYRYSQAWYLKVEHPDWSVSRCLAESAEIMDGQKKKRFCLDLYFLGVALLAGLALAAIFVLSAFIGAVGGFMQSLSMMVGVVAGIAIMLWYELARAVFYEKLRQVACTAAVADSDAAGVLGATK